MAGAGVAFELARWTILFRAGLRLGECTLAGTTGTLSMTRSTLVFNFAGTTGTEGTGAGDVLSAEARLADELFAAMV